MQHEVLLNITTGLWSTNWLKTSILIWIEFFLEVMLFGWVFVFELRWFELCGIGGVGEVLYIDDVCWVSVICWWCMLFFSPFPTWVILWIQIYICIRVSIRNLTDWFLPKKKKLNRLRLRYRSWALVNSNIYAYIRLSIINLINRLRLYYTFFK